MLALRADFDPLTARADEVFQRGVHVQCIAHLIEVRHLQVGALANLAAVGFEFAQDHFQQSRLARTVGADQAHFVAAQEGSREVFGNDFASKGFVYFGEFGHDLACRGAASHVKLDTANGISASFALFTQRI